MKKLLYYLKLYRLIISQYIKIRMQFRVDFFISTIGVLAANITGLLTFKILFQSISNLKGWNFHEITFMYAFTLLALSPQQILFDNIFNLKRHLLEGSFIKYYFRPINMLFYYISEIFDLKGIGQLILSITLLVYTSGQLDIRWDFFKILMLLINLWGASLVMVSLMLLAASSGFWILNSSSLITFTLRLRDFAKYPITIFNSFFRFFFSFLLPMGFISYYPCLLFLRPEDKNILAFLPPFIGLLLFAIARFVWKKGVNSYTGTGS